MWSELLRNESISQKVAENRDLTPMDFIVSQNLWTKEFFDRIWKKTIRKELRTYIQQEVCLNRCVLISSLLIIRTLMNNTHI